MPRRLSDIAADLAVLTAHDFDYANTSAHGWERLDALCDEIRAVNDPSACAPLLLGTMERLDGVDLGTPGPLVHTLEIWSGGYESLLLQSIQRKPSFLSVLMVNRILNARPVNADVWIALLRSVLDNPAATAATRAEAQRFIEYQSGH